MNAESTTAAAGHATVGHVTSMKILLRTWGALMALTVLTVAASWVHMGSMNLFVAVGIAAAKATIVALYFMHLRWDAGFNRVVFLTAILFVTIFISITLMDTLAYAPERDLGYAPAVNH